jgi:transcriptional regulator with XRE-family HTH domain
MKLLYAFLAEIKKVGMAKVARMSGYSINTIQSWVYGRSVPSLLNAQKVANAIGMEFLLFDKVD